MFFSSYPFVFLFLPLTVAGYWTLLRIKGSRAATGWLLLSSIAFYACASLTSLLVILPSVLLDFVLAKAFFSLSPDKSRRRAILIGAGITANILFLAWFKYSSIFLAPISAILGRDSILTSTFLPLGISFLTFQKIAFLCDSYAGQISKIEFGDFLLFTLFYPRTVAGPIVHYKEVMPQFNNVRPAHAALNISIGFCLFSIGLFKKCVIADGIVKYVGNAFGLPALVGPVPFFGAWSGVLAYTLQLYFDFSGYSDMALGAARMLGIRLPMNFNSPLKASSIIDFWARWHITLTRFLTWYIYIPLVRRFTRARAARGKTMLRGQRSTPGAIASLIGVPTAITMLVSGIWHGVGWPFVIWGLLHGAYLTVNQAWRLWRPRFWKNQQDYNRIMKPVGVLLTLGSVIFGLVLFRAASVSEALSIVAGMVGLHGNVPLMAHLVSQTGYSFDWTIVWEPWEPFKWILPLFCVVLFCPNSLELMRQFEPALNFPVAEALATEGPKSIGTHPVAAHGGAFPTFRRAWGIIGRLKRTGLTFNHLTAAMIGVLFTLGTMAIEHSIPFMYGVF
jgi:alginate O-acetyltransferase complex protein AlgI